MTVTVPVANNVDNEAQNWKDMKIVQEKLLSPVQTAVATVSVASLAFLIVQIANRLESKFAYHLDTRNSMWRDCSLDDTNISICSL